MSSLWCKFAGFWHSNIENYIDKNAYFGVTKATPIGNYVSGPPPASFLKNVKFQKYMGLYGENARISILKNLNFRNKCWVD